VTRRELLLGAAGAAAVIALPCSGGAGFGSCRDQRDDLCNNCSSPKRGWPKRKWVYVQSPSTYEISGCSCGNHNPQWSEFMGMLWCATCKKDFYPEHGGIFDGPIPVHALTLMGISLDRYNLETQEIEPFWEEKS
jgi:hypothetical protein